jgi:hypothetical protein
VSFRSIDEQHAGPALHDEGVALDELALVSQHTLRDLLGTGGSFRLQPLVETVALAVEVFGDRRSLLVLHHIVFGDRRYFRDLQAGSEEGIASWNGARMPGSCAAGAGMLAAVKLGGGSLLGVRDRR